MLEGRGEEQADTGPGWWVPAPVSPGCHPSRCCLGEHPLHAAHPTRLRDEPEQGSWSRAPRAELRLGAATEEPRSQSQ